MKETIKKIKKIQEIADKDCSCSEAQKTGEDASLCRSCYAASALNRITEEVDNIYELYLGK